MTYNETLEFLFSQLPAYHRIGKAAYKNDLSNTKTLDNYFKNPHLNYRTIHIAGTNGKGSVSHMIASVLQEAGYKTGLYTSPHLKDFRERIKVNGSMIPENEVISFVEKNMNIIVSVKPSFFEMTVAMALNFFAQCKIDVAVIEVGLGGRLDSTNIINPVLSVITNIGHDHMDLLGNTIEKIAFEKAGIIKKEIPVVISETQAETQRVFILKAAEMKSDIQFADQNFSCNLEDLKPFNGERKYVIKDYKSGRSFKGTVSLGGDYQAKNIAGVYQVFDALKDILNTSVDNIINGIERVTINTGLQGRWQVLSHDPFTVCDTGHNKEGLEYVMNQIERLPRTALHIIVGFVSDKDLSAVLPLFPQDAFYYFTKASVPRALNEETLRSEAEIYGLKGECYPSVGAAMEAAKHNAKPSDMIFIGGSTFVVAEVV